MVVGGDGFLDEFKAQLILIPGKFEVMTLSADEDEHSIEMQLPYIAKVRFL